MEGLAEFDRTQTERKSGIRTDLKKLHRLGVYACKALAEFTLSLVVREEL
jgi:hypothetical protein